MKKARLEAFSDGVFAIVITLLILDIKLPQGEYNHLSEGLISILPNIGVYVLSFLLIGMYWMFHHQSFTFVQETDGVIIWLNILFLLFISFLPFPTSLMGEYPFQTLPVLIYGANLMLANSIGFISIIYLHKNRQLATEVFSVKRYKSQIRIYITVNVLYLLCIILAFFHPKASCIMFGLTAIFLILRSIAFMGIGKCNFGKSLQE